jgi:hypothetical protein
MSPLNEMAISCYPPPPAPGDCSLLLVLNRCLLQTSRILGRSAEKSYKNKEGWDKQRFFEKLYCSFALKHLIDPLRRIFKARCKGIHDETTVHKIYSIFVFSVSVLLK